MTTDRDHLQPPHSHSVEIARRRRKLILCFDGTGNKFKGNAGDTNILKIFRMLDRSGPEQFHYYQPGIGTYITNGTLSRVHVYSRFKSWCEKAMDAAIGTSFDEHVIGGYKFLMRHYSPGDDIILFGFSRGAYTARFLAEMLDHVGLVSQGNEEMIMFAWKTFSNWQQRRDGDGWSKEKEKMYNYMKAFRETFARPVRRIRFLGLFDTVNAVPRFESAWLDRSANFPYTAQSTARVIRHAVGIDERRAKFRQDLVEKGTSGPARQPSFKAEALLNMEVENGSARRASTNGHGEHQVYQNRSGPRHHRFSGSHERLPSVTGDKGSVLSLDIHAHVDNDEDEDAEQDIQEVWFPGAHGDIGGGWDLPDGEESLSHGPLVWMVREARKAGVVFDTQRMKENNCWLDDFEPEESSLAVAGIPTIEISSDSPASTPDILATKTTNHPSPNGIARINSEASRKSSARQYLLNAYTKGRIHDCLCWPEGGLTLTGTLGWKMMEYLPFRRMDLQPDGSWKPIVWPLPRGEVRDIPDNVTIHNSVIRRMMADENYRPGNLIVGGGGRGVKRAPKSFGIGEWVVLEEKGDLVGELLGKRSK